MKIELNIMSKATLIGSVAGIASVIISSILGLSSTMIGCALASALVSGNIVRKHYEELLMSDT